MLSLELSFEPADGIIVPTERRLADVISFSTGQLLGPPEKAARLLANDQKTGFKFALFSHEFIQLQLVTTQALALPIAVNSFEETYGSFESKETVTNCVEAIKKLNTLCGQFGNPAKLRSEIEALGKGDKPPTLYGQIVWLAQRIANTAENFSLNLKSLKEILDQISDPGERYQALKEIVSGSGGLVSEAEAMEKQTTALRKDLLEYTTKMVNVKAPISKYFSKSSEIYTQAVKRNKDLTDRITIAQSELSAARDEYTKYVAAAAGSSVGLFVLSGGILWPLSAVAGGVLGHLAEQARKRANELESQISTLNAEAAQKARLVLDVSGMQLGIAPVNDQLRKVCDGLGEIAGVWNNVTSRFQNIVEQTSPDALKDLSNWLVISRLFSAKDKWQQIAETTFDFTAKAFVEISDSSARSA